MKQNSVFKLQNKTVTSSISINCSNSSPGVFEQYFLLQNVKWASICHQEVHVTKNTKKTFLGVPPKQIPCMENTDVASPSSRKLATTPLFNITFLYFLMCLFFRHPASHWLRYTGCLLSFCLKESLSPPDLVSLWSVEQRGKNECRTNKWRKNRPPLFWGPGEG